jgi:hypothetical protein
VAEHSALVLAELRNIRGDEFQFAAEKAATTLQAYAL